MENIRSLMLKFGQKSFSLESKSILNGHFRHKFVNVDFGANGNLDMG